MSNRGRAEKDQREEITVQGKQEAIIPEEMWKRVQAKRKQGAVRYEKDEPERISMLSGLVKCPVCGAGLVVKKSKTINRNRGGHYKPIHYYACRYYRKSEGRRCGFHHTYNQKKLDSAVMEILVQLTRTEEFQMSTTHIIRRLITSSSGQRTTYRACTPPSTSPSSKKHIPSQAK